MLDTKQSKKTKLPNLGRLDHNDLNNFKIEFDKAETLLKEVEEFCDEVAIPAINELRYSGHHLAIAIAGNVDNPQAELEKAINHCRRASYDASSAGISSAITLIDTFSTEYADVPISDVITDWSVKKVRVNEIRDTLPSSRTNGTQKGADHEDQSNAFYEVRDFYRELDASRDDFKRKIKQGALEGRRFWVGLITATIIAIVGIIVSV